MDGLALTSVITSGVVGLSGGALTFFGPITAARQEHRAKKHDRRADVYLDVLRTAELESRALMARTVKWEIAGNEGIGTQPREVRPADVDEEAAVVARLRAFGSTGVRVAYDIWRGSADAVAAEHEYQQSGWDLNSDEPSTERLTRELHPAEDAARSALADIIASELDVA